MIVLLVSAWCAGGNGRGRTWIQAAALERLPCVLPPDRDWLAQRAPINEGIYPRMGVCLEAHAGQRVRLHAGRGRPGSGTLSCTGAGNYLASAVPDMGRDPARCHLLARWPAAASLASAGSAIVLPVDGSSEGNRPAASRYALTGSPHPLGLALDILHPPCCWLPVELGGPRAYCTGSQRTFVHSTGPLG